MKILKMGLLSLFGITLVLFIATLVFQWRGKDDTLPVISCDQEQIAVRIDEPESHLLEGVTAFDEKDGDLTDQVFIEYISNFLEPGIAKVTYAVVDSNNHVAKLTRSVYYQDYVSPHFTLADDLVFQTGSNVVMTDLLGAQDVIDGNISSRVRITSPDLTTSTEGVYHIAAKITNSRGDSAELELPVYVVKRDSMAPVVLLSEYLVYLDKGSSFRPEDYFKQVTLAGTAQAAASEDYELDIESPVNTMLPGVYQVTYSATDQRGHQGMSVLNVIVEE